MKCNTERRKHALLFLHIMIVIELVYMVSSLFQYLLLEEYNAGTFVSDQRLENNDLRQQVVAILYFVLYATTAIVYQHWFRRAYYNIGKISRKEYTDGWAVGGWFVPIISLFYPYKIMKEIFQKTNLYLKSYYDNQPKVIFTTIGWWWALWLVSNIYENISFRFSDYETIEGLTNSTIADMLGSCISLGAAFLAIKVIQDYAPLEDKLYKTYNKQKAVEITKREE